ncbi:MAG TPA: FkbM family methyltransferase [Solirubrobacteraceae bacterium]|nr:FkbM family methyltransferase [Solirubrobacteraceae bacterium]
MTGAGSLKDRVGRGAARIGGAVATRAWREMGRLQHSSEAGRRIVETATRPLRHRDMRVMRGRIAGARINLGGSFLRYLTGDAEPEVQEALAALIEPGQTVYDVGANIGFFTMLCSRLVGPQGRVYAFEPIPQNLATLRHNVALNDLANVTIVEQALSSSTGTAEMFISPWSAFHSLNVEGASKQDNHGPEAGQITVQTVTLDEFLKGEGVRAPDLLKIDVEGAELIVLEGAGETLRSRKPLLLCELHDTHAAYGEFIDSIGYDLRVIEGESTELADAPRNVHTIAWPREREPRGLAGLAPRS